MKWKILTGVVTVIVVLGVVVSLYLVNERNVNKIVEQGERANILFMGLDYVQGTSRSDTMMLASVGPNIDGVKLISIPRDMYCKYPNGDFRRVNAAYPIGGADLARRVVSDLLGVEIPFYAALDYQGFKKLVNLIGGVELTVERRLKYTDTAATPPLNIDISPGRQVLKGDQALGYIRYRAGGSDLQRIDRQQKFLEALLKQGLQFRSWTELKDLIGTAREYMKTNLSLVDLYDLGKMVRGVSVDDLYTVTLPGKGARVGDKAVLQPQIVGIRRIVAEQFRGVDLLGKSDISVLVLNGEGSAWLAHNISNQLKRMGFKVVGADNADRFNYDNTYIVNLADNGKKANMLYNSLEIPRKVVSDEEFSNQVQTIKQSGVTVPGQTDLIVILGKGSKKLVS